jgi:LacI family transcriptional regulator
MTAKARISDVARRARVSVGTVSHVLTGSANVSAARRDRVLKAIEALGYVPNFHAQGLRRTLSRVVGICFPHASTSYLSTLAETLEEIASRDGYGVMHVFSRHDPTTELDRIKELIRYRVDGLVLMPSSTPKAALDFVSRKAVPLVIVDRPTEDTRFDQVIIDNRKAMRELARQLIERGHDRFVFVCLSRGRLVSQHRIAGLETARRSAGRRIELEVIEFQNDDAFLRDELTRALRGAHPHTAIVVSNSHQASLVLGFLRDLGIACPRDVSIVAFDDPEWSRLVTPPLSVVRQPAAAMAQATWELLMHRVTGTNDPTRTIALEPAVELRESVANPTGRTREAPASDPAGRAALLPGAAGASATPDAALGRRRARRGRGRPRHVD